MSPEVEIEHLLGAFAAAYAGRDLAAISALFAHDDAVVMYGTQKNLHLVGWAALRDSLQKQFAAVEQASLAHRDTHVRVLAGKRAASVATLLDYRAVISGASVEALGARATYALEQRGGRWRIVHMHWSYDRGEVLVRH